MFEAILVALVIFMLLPAILGLYVLWYVLVLPMKPPADTSNRIAHLRLVWWAIKHPHKFVSLFPWLKLDEGEALK